MLLFKTGYDLLSIAQIVGGMEVDAAFLPGIFRSVFLPLFSRFGIEAASVAPAGDCAEAAAQKTASHNTVAAGSDHGTSYSFSAWRSARHTFSGVSGSDFTRAPVHQNTAFATAGATGMMPPSPNPLAP